jgi:opacity protein-like surface antigen
MKRIVLAVFVVACLAGVGSLSAQEGIRVGVGGGVLMPMGDYKTADKLGWLAGADVTYWLTSTPIGIRGDFQYSQTSHKSGVPGNSKIIGGMAEIVYAFGAQADQIRPYILGGIGYYNVKVSITGFGDFSESKVGFGGGAGVAFKVGTGSTRVFVEGKFVNVSTSGSSTTFLPIRAGFRFGGNK